MKKIAILPQVVVDRIAAGEVVQRPAAAVKELLENSLDAGSTEVIVQTDGIDRIIVSDDGCGIDHNDLQLAAVRHATSKIRTAEDLNTIESFGFRGEALASISMVSRLSIVSRTASQQAAYKLSYLDGIPTNDKPIPIARKVGTTITVQDLFYNMSHRRTGKVSDAYNATLRVVQQYAIHYASLGISFHCQRMNTKSGTNTGRTSSSMGTKTDLNTSNAVMPLRKRFQQTYKNNNDNTAIITSTSTDSCSTSKEQQINATKQVIAQVYGSQLLPYLNDFSCSLIHDVNNVEAPGTGECTNDNDVSKGSVDENINNMDHNGVAKFVYSCSGILSSTSYQSSKGSSSSNIQFILFINNRLVDGCPSIKRTVESVYGLYTKVKPFIYLSIIVPPHEVDVNVHPTKREVALLHLDEICNDLSLHIKQHLSALGESFPVVTNSDMNGGNTNPYSNNNKKRKPNDSNRNITDDTKTCQQQQKQIKTVVPSKLIRNTRGTQSGSLEPFLISTQQSLSPLLIGSASLEIGGEDNDETFAEKQARILQPQLQHQVLHKPDCPLLATAGGINNLEVDVSVPGAFAKIASQCTCFNLASVTNSEGDPDLLSPAGTIRLPRQPLVRPKHNVPHPCSYKSIQSLRKSVETKTDHKIQRKLRSACYVGVVSHDRSLIQCGEELVMLNHYECSRELFYQLALNRFGSGDGAVFSNDAGIDIASAIGQLIQMEETMRDVSPFLLDAKEQPNCNLIQVDETNQAAAEQAAECLLENSEMLGEYFCILIEKICTTTDNKIDRKIVLKGLPILLDGYQPAPHGMPLFLLRLATEVDWEDEKRCFHDISQELASYYAQLPSSKDHASLVRHTVFPAVTTLLYPSKNLTNGENFLTIATLTRLYKIFERC